MKNKLIKLICLLITTFLSFGVFACSKPYEPVENKPKEKVKLMFEIEEGISGKELSSKFKNDLPKLNAALNNIYAGIEPLREKYDVVVQIYPTWHYNEKGFGGDASNGLNRISKELKHTLNFFMGKGVPFYLEIHSSGIRTNQNGELGELPPAPLNFGESEKCKSLPMDMQALEALKQEYGVYFEGVRMHELIGSHNIGVNDKANGNEENSHAWVVQERVVKGIIDTCKKLDLHLVWSDHSWNEVKKNQDKESYKIFDSWLDYAIDNLKPNRFTINWANNGWPIHQYIVESFAYKNYRNSSFGMSVQDWFWQELDCSTMRDENGNTKWYTDADIDCPPELMYSFAKNAIDQGAKLIQFEPPQYFFNTSTPRVSFDRPVTSLEGTQIDYSAKIALKRFVDYMLNDKSTEIISTNILDYYDEDRDRFNQNKESDPAKRYYQSTLVALNGENLKVHDRYSDKKTRWFEQSENRFRDYVLDKEIIAAQKIALTFSCNDEILFIKNDEFGVHSEIYNSRSGKMETKNDIFVTNKQGEVVSVAPINLISKNEHTLSGDPDEVLVARKLGNKINIELYQAATGISAITQDFQFDNVTEINKEKIIKLLGGLQFEADNFKGLIAPRTRNSVNGNMTRPIENTVFKVFVENNNKAKLVGSLRGEAYEKSYNAGAEILSFAAIDTDCDFVDEIALSVKDGSGSNVLFLNVNDLTVKEELKMEIAPKILFGLRTGTYTKAF